MIAWGLSYVPQEQALFQDLSIRDNLRLAVRSDGELGAALDHAFGYFPFLEREAQTKSGHTVGRRTEDVDSRPRPHASTTLAAH